MSAAEPPTEPSSGDSPQEETVLRPLMRVPDYEVIHFIGRGSYGEVWLARNIMGERRAVKFVSLRAFDGSERLF
jgi:serine/threonine protein kinase